MTNEEALKQAVYRYHHDPEFHARVLLSVRAIEQEWRRTGCELDGPDRSLATQAAALGVIAAEQPVTNDITNTMAQASHMPWLIRPRKV